ncbi:hypothetical protein [Streptomyces sp. BE133]|uniref:hypothetical protein n=1 Tax=Streptomyces sp. BE133 TaxID=3002523 RepID=UPI002E77C531|nr:hypothetical protein [Streptomyces sp. BE133]MEE1808155.1 hypothetical protein [Streptomyces sp. BE133]
MRAVTGFASEAHPARFVRARSKAEFACLPERSGYTKRLRVLADTLTDRFIRALARDTDPWHDDVWLVDSTPVARAHSRLTLKRSEPAPGPDTAGHGSVGAPRSPRWTAPPGRGAAVG